MRYKVFILAFSLFVISFQSFSQSNKIEMEIGLDRVAQTLNITQRITYYNYSLDTLTHIYFHDWNNAFSDKNTALGKRFIENYKKKFFFTKEANRGFTTIHNIVVNHQSVQWERKKSTDDFFYIILPEKLNPKTSVRIDLNYSIKIPHSKFTGYGVRKDEYNLRYWYITPVVYENKWYIMHNLNMDDLYENPTDFTLTIELPDKYTINSNLKISKEGQHYRLTGKETKDIELYLAADSDYKHFFTDGFEIVTNLNTIEIGDQVKTDIINRQLLFFNEKIGRYKGNKILINKTKYSKNPLYGFNQLPNFLRPFSDIFEWDLRMFKVLSDTYIKQNISNDTRDDTWFVEGLTSYLMMQYVSRYYKNTKLIGNASKIWGIKSYYISDLYFNDRFHFTYQYVANKNRDQALTTPTDSLTNFNRLVFNRFKAGMGLHYLDNYLGDSIIHKAIIAFFKDKKNQKNPSIFLKTFLQSHSSKEIDWFFTEYLPTSKKVDFSLKKIYIKRDSLKFKVNNKKKSKIPVALYGLHNDSIKTKKWLINTDTTLVFKRDTSISRWVLNYEKNTPETRLSNNWLSTKKTLFKKPLRVRWLIDTEDPYHTQVFVEPKFYYNYYDGFMLASSFSNKNLLKKEFEYSITPAYGFKSKSLTGSFKTIYWHYPKNDFINSYRIGMVGSSFHYKNDLSYSLLAPYAQIFLKRKNLRSVKRRTASISYTMVNREVESNTTQTDADRYNIVLMRYVYSNPDIINNFLFSTNLEIGDSFSKFSTDIRYRKLTNSKRQFEVRLFSGFFLTNNTNTDYFSYGINRPNDYLFRYRYYGRSETSGLFSQQFITTDASFKSKMPVAYANQWVTSLNTSIGLWRWFEIYNDVGFAKNRGQKVFFMHDKGIRLNFIHNVFEIYFPVHSTNGWEITQPNYEERIRFVFTSDIKSIISFLKRGFM